MTRSSVMARPHARTTGHAAATPSATPVRNSWNRAAHDSRALPAHPQTIPVEPNVPSESSHCKLVIGSAADALEAQADQVAMRVPSGLPPAASKFAPAASTEFSQAEAPPIVHQALRSSGRPFDGQIRSFMEQHLGHDFGDVRIHSDETAGVSARAVNALAYSVGRHIVFGQGRCAPDSVSGLRLLAHELAHVAQDRAATSAGAAPILRRAVSTWGGEWDTTKYTDLASKDGVDIELHFKPGPEADATSIGIVQKVTSKQNGATGAVNPTVGARSIPAGKTGEGAHIDQLARFINPLFATGDTPAAKHLWDSPTHAVWGQHGFRHVDSKGKLFQGDAILKDTPTLPGAGANSSQIFEDTALAVTGVQTGATYGSVQWGWKIDGAGKFARLPLTKVSDDVPSGTFKAAENLWNKSKSSTGADLIKVFTASRKFIQANDTPLVADPGDAAKTEIAKLPQDTRVEVINRGVWEKFNTSNPAVKWWKVTVTDGASIGKTGWVISSQLGDAKVAGAPGAAP